MYAVSINLWKAQGVSDALLFGKLSLLQILLSVTSVYMQGCGHLFSLRAETKSSCSPCSILAENMHVGQLKCFATLHV